MGATYTRQSTYTDGDVIQSADTNDEFNQLLAAFQASSGHTHDGTANEGGPITKMLGTSLTLGDGTAGTDITVTFDGESNDGVLTWMEDEDHFKFSDDIVIDSTKKLYLNDEGGEHISGDATDLTIASGNDINLTATTDINIPANVGLTFGDDAEKIEGDGTDLTVSGNNINLTAVADVNIPSGVGLTFATAEKIESDGTDLSITVGSGGDINIPANIGMTFGDDGEKIEGDGTDLTITGNNINLTATADIVVPADVGITFGSGEKIEGDSTDLTITSGAKINLTATSDVHIPNNVGVVFGGDSEKIEGDGTDMTISANNLTVDAVADITLDAGGADVVLKDDGTQYASFTNSSGNLIVKSGSTTMLTGSGANATFAGNVTVDGNLDVTGTFDLSDSNFTNAGDIQLDSITGDGDTNTAITFSGSDVITISAGGDNQVTFTNGAIVPSTDNDIDLGTSSVEFKDAFFDGTVTTDALVADTANIDGGSIDGATLGTNSAITQAVIDNVNINGATIGHTDDTDLLTLADGIVTVAGEISVTTLDIGGTNVTSTAAELNLLDGVSGLVQADFTKLAAVDSTATELNIVDGDTSATSTTVADADRVVYNDAGTMKQVAVTDLDTYFSATTKTLTNKTLTTPTLTTPIANAGIQLKNGSTSAGFLEFFEDSDNGTNKVTLIGPSSTSDITLTLPSSAGTVATTATAADEATALAIALG